MKDSSLPPPGAPEDLDAEHTGWSSVPNWVVRSSRLGASEKLVYIALINRCDKRGMCHPSLSTIARDASISRRTAVTVLGTLEDRGYIKKTRRFDGDQFTSNVYKITTWSGSANIAPPSEELAPGSANEHLGVVQPLHRGSANGTQEVLPIEVIPNGSKTQEDTSAREVAADPFDVFWKTYPRKAEKPRARKAYASAIKRASVETILAGAVRHRDDPNREDAYTKHPATWLNGDCWDDDPLPDRQTGNSRALSPPRLATADQRLADGAALIARLAAEESQSRMELEA